MIENEKQLLDVMAKAAFDERRKGREGDFLTWDMLGILSQGNVKLEIRAALLAAQAEGAEMVPRNPTPDMTATGWPSRAVEGDLRMIWGFYSDMLSANPLRIKEEP